MIRIDSTDPAALEGLPAGWVPTPEQLLAAPLLEGWFLAAPYLVGVAYGHPLLPTHPDGQGRLVRTSSLLVFAPGLGWARTENRFYRLGDSWSLDGIRLFGGPIGPRLH